MTLIFKVFKKRQKTREEIVSWNIKFQAKFSLVKMSKSPLAAVIDLHVYANALKLFYSEILSESPTGNRICNLPIAGEMKKVTGSISAMDS